MSLSIAGSSISQPLLVRHIMMVFWQLLLGGAAITKQLLNSVIMLLKKKYADRKKKGELKSGTIKPKQLVHGFASLNEANVKLLGDFFSIFDANSYIYLFCASKIEYVITQLFKGYRNSVFFDMDAARYSIVKAIVTYRPTEVIESLYKSPAEFVAALMTFLTNRIRRNKENRELKAQENTAFEAVLYVLNNVDVPQSLAWDYHSQFVGFGNS